MNLSWPCCCLFVYDVVVSKKYAVDFKCSVCLGIINFIRLVYRLVNYQICLISMSPLGWFCVVWFEVSSHWLLGTGPYDEYLQACRAAIRVGGFRGMAALHACNYPREGGA